MCSVKWEIRYENNAIWLSGEPVSVLDFPYCPKISCFFAESKYIILFNFKALLLLAVAKLLQISVRPKVFPVFFALVPTKPIHFSIPIQNRNKHNRAHIAHGKRYDTPCRTLHPHTEMPVTQAFIRRKSGKSGLSASSAYQRRLPYIKIFRRELPSDIRSKQSPQTERLCHNTMKINHSKMKTMKHKTLHTNEKRNPQTTANPNIGRHSGFIVGLLCGFSTVFLYLCTQLFQV